MSKKDKKKKKGLSKATLLDCINLHKQKALQTFMTSWYRRYDAIEKEVVSELFYKAFTETISLDEINNMDLSQVYQSVQDMISKINYDDINRIRTERLMKVYEMDKSIWKFRSDQLDKRGRNTKSFDSPNGIDFLMVKNIRSKWIDVNIGRYVVSFGYVFSWEVDSDVISSAITNDWNDLTDSIPMYKIYDAKVSIKPITSLGLKVKEVTESSIDKQSYVTRIIPQETSVVIIDL